MQLVDANVLLYATNQDAEEHGLAARWLDEALSGMDPVGFAWMVLLAYLRLATRPGLFPRPLTTTEAVEQVGGWLAQPPAVVVQPGSRHLPLLAGLLEPLGTAANLVNDAHLAALALENSAVVVSFDNDFGRFSGVRWRRPEPA